jgi:hypothetical protein
MIRKTRRTFTKAIVGLNYILGWGSIYYAIGTNQSTYYGVAALSFLTGLGAYYMKVGHDDFKATLTAMSSSRPPEIQPESYNGPAMPEPEDTDASSFNK